ncbi:NUDIX domain-containing protein [Parvibaculum sp.]|uniref:NUDIX hydrolase n=1 Tax=Parvibaculum sp. TaxID=2024848 RepID=UPI001D649E82|nr:NUDIX domain-containing protein [Parvibaculum sp.]MBX3490442.1 NUDIX domain-containing protein [Parvibaculum sp.]MCW5728300.1 NUDIX domain-containing protein [Parvibaculum sp.]
MRPRPTARVLLFDTTNRLLLIRMHDPAVGGADGAVLRDAYWVTIGGEIEPGETPEEAARRELAEETGLTDARLGPNVWYTEHVLTVGGEKRLLQEHFFIAHTGKSELATAGWTGLERAVIRDMRWWALPDLMASEDIFFPSSLRRHLPALLESGSPSGVIRIEP